MRKGLAVGMETHALMRQKGLKAPGFKRGQIPNEAPAS